MEPSPAESVYLRTEADTGPATPVRRRRRPRVLAPGGLSGGRAAGIGKPLNDVGSQLVRRRQVRVPRPGSLLFHVAEQDERLFHRLQGRGEVLAISQPDRRGGAQARGEEVPVGPGCDSGQPPVDVRRLLDGPQSRPFIPEVGEVYVGLGQGPANLKGFAGR